MAKTLKLKPNAVSSSASSGGNLRRPHSRASKRASSPSINLDKSLTSVPRHSDGVAAAASSSTAHNHRAVANGGIKKNKQKQQKTRNQRLRQEKGLARAELVLEKLEKKVEGSQGKRERREGRKVGWEEVNGRSKKERKKAMAAVKKGAAEEEAWVDDEDNDAGADADADAEMVGVFNALPKAVEEKLVVADRAASTDGADVDDNIT